MKVRFARSGRSQKNQLDVGWFFAISEPDIFCRGLDEGPQASIASIPLRATAARLFGLNRRSTHARRHDRHVRKGHRRRKLSLHDLQFSELAALLQTFRQTMERPYIIRVLCTSLNSSAQAQI